MWSIIVIVIVYIIVVWSLYNDCPDYRRDKPESGRTRSKFAERLRELFDKGDDSFD